MILSLTLTRESFTERDKRRRGRGEGEEMIEKELAIFLDCGLKNIRPGWLRRVRVYRHEIEQQ